MLLQWKKVNRSWHRCVNSHSGPNNHWQYSLRVDLRAEWQTLYRRATAVVCENKDPRTLPQQEETRTLIHDLCTTLKEHSYSRALTGGIAVIILMLTRPNPNYRETLGTLGGYPPPRTHNPFNHERLLLKHLLSAAVLRHGLAPTPWHSSRTGPRYTSHDVLEDSYFDVLPRLQEHRLSHDNTPEEQHFRAGDIPPPAIQDTDMKRTEAQHRGLDLLQILQALMEMGNGSEDFPMGTHKIREMQQYHRSLISHLFILLPILFLTH